MYSGYLIKEARESLGVGLLDQVVNDSGLRDTLARRWFLLISSKPIIHDAIDPADEDILDQGRLPFDIEMDVLYCYEDECNDSHAIENYPLKDVTEVVIKKRTNDESMYRFVVKIVRKHF
jgi:hypothetical protein